MDKNKAIGEVSLINLKGLFKLPQINKYYELRGELLYHKGADFSVRQILKDEKIEWMGA